MRGILYRQKNLLHIDSVQLCPLGTTEYYTYTDKNYCVVLHLSILSVAEFQCSFECVLFYLGEQSFNPVAVGKQMASIVGCKHRNRPRLSCCRLSIGSTW